MTVPLEGTPRCDYDEEDEADENEEDEDHNLDDNICEGIAIYIFMTMLSIAQKRSKLLTLFLKLDM